MPADRAARITVAARARLAAAIAVGAMLAGCGGTVPASIAAGSQTAASHSAAAPSPSASGAPTGAATSTPPLSAASPTPADRTVSPPSSALSTPSPDDGAQAAQTASDYLLALAAGRYADAWQILSPQSREFRGSEEQFAAERAAFYKTAGPRYTVLSPDRSAEALAQWLPNPFDGAADRASVLRVDHPALGPNNAAWEILIAAPGTDGAWHIWVAR